MNLQIKENDRQTLQTQRNLLTQENQRLAQDNQRLTQEARSIERAVAGLPGPIGRELEAALRNAGVRR